MKCKCPEGFPIERRFVELIDRGVGTSVVIRGHTGECPLSDTIVRFD